MKAVVSLFSGDLVGELFRFVDLFNLVEPEEHFGGVAAPGRKVGVLVRRMLETLVEISGDGLELFVLLLHGLEDVELCNLNRA